MAEIDWKALQQDAKETVLPDGDYAVQVVKSEATSASTGKPMIKLQLAVIEGPRKDRKVFTQLTLTADNPFALQRWFAQLASFGLDAAYFNGQPSMEKVAADLMNRGAIVTLGQREWQNTMRNEVQAYRPYAPSGPIPPGMVIGPAGAGPTTRNAPAAPVATPASSAPPVPTAPASPASAPSTPPPDRPF